MNTIDYIVDVTIDQSREESCYLVHSKYSVFSYTIKLNTGPDENAILEYLSSYAYDLKVYNIAKPEDYDSQRWRLLMFPMQMTLNSILSHKKQFIKVGKIKYSRVTNFNAAKIVHSLVRCNSDIRTHAELICLLHILFIFCNRSMLSG